VSGSGVDDDPRLLVDYDDVAVLVQYLKWNRFRLIINRLGIRYMALDPVTGF
jgi:hypothetical protein